MNTFMHIPPGFRFHPTDEELVDYYLRKKVASRKIDLDVIKDVDLYKIEPWDLHDLCKIGTEEQSEWYFFSHKDKKYPTGTRTNRATKAGFWKATGRDKAIYAKHCLVGMRKTLVFYKGRAPNGQKSDWIMHEYRLETNEKGTSQEEGWAICRVFKKRITMVRKMSDDPDYWFDEQISFVPEIAPPTHTSLPYAHYHLRPFPCKQELDQQFQYNVHHDPRFIAFPQLDSPNTRRMSYSPITAYRFDFQNSISNLQSNQQKPIGECTFAQDCEADQASREQVTDWRVLDKFVASQLSQEDAQKESSYSDRDAARGLGLIMNSPFISGSDKQELSIGHLSASSSSCPIDL